MYKVVFVLLSVLLLLACVDETQRQQNAERTKQYQVFITLYPGDTFTLSDFNLIEPSISYRDSYTTVYRVRYHIDYTFFWWHVTVDNSTSKVRMVRSFK